jgi:Response regulator containing CheY-like receiver domain and AraC-type DNA-binding domain
MLAPAPDAPPPEGFVVTAYEDSMRREPARLRPHYHGFFQASLLVGTGRLMVDFREKTVRGHTLFFVSPGQVHTVRPGPDMHGTIVSFTREFFDAGSEDAARLLLEFPFYFAGDAPAWLSLGKPDTDADSASLVDLFRRLQREQDESAPGAAEVIRSLLRILLVKAARLHSRRNPSTPKTTRAAVIVREFQLLVEKHFLQETALSAYARRLGVGVNHLNDVVRETTGRSAGEHIRQRRLLSAKRQLLHSELSVSEIGYRLGFKDPSYFSRFFRRYAGVAPGDFRTASREKYRQSAR